MTIIWISRRSSRRPTSRAFSMIETTVCILIVGITLVAALNTLGASVSGQSKTNDRSVGQLLAQALMSEILQQAYVEPVDTPAFGRESGESASSRANYDDVDDYDGYTESPPQMKDGTILTEYAGWQRTVSVNWASGLDFRANSLIDSGLKRIVVTVSHNGVTAATTTAVRSDSWRRPGD